MSFWRTNQFHDIRSVFDPLSPSSRSLGDPQQDPYLRNLESRFALQRKIVEAAKKLANEAELCKTVKKKRRRNCLDAMHKLQQVEDEMNQYRIKKGKKPTQRASLIIAGETPSFRSFQHVAVLVLKSALFHSDGGNLLDFLFIVKSD